MSDMMSTCRSCSGTLAYTQVDAVFGPSQLLTRKKAGLSEIRALNLIRKRSVMGNMVQVVADLENLFRVSLSICKSKSSGNE